MKLTPLHDRVVLTILEPETATSSGIVIPDIAKESPTRGRVLAVGSGRVLPTGTVLSMSISVGDEVLFGKYSGQTVKVDGEELVILKEDEIFAVIEK